MGQQIAFLFNLWHYISVKMLVHPRLDRRAYLLKVRIFVGHIVLKIGPIRDVTINKKVRLPLVPESEPSARFRSVGLHVIAIKVEIRCVRSKTHLVGAVLVDSHIRVRILMPVDVVDHLEKNDDILEQIEPRFGDCDIAQERESSVLTVNLPRVYSSLDQNDRLPLRPRRGRCKGLTTRRDQQWQ